ncbi:MAG: putative membrane protein [Verrucomicrobia bacterium]|nr:MAG: putative membrane protein [Verrucomicrobiota bacterium]
MGGQITFAPGMTPWWLTAAAVLLAGWVVWQAYRRPGLRPPWNWVCAGLKFVLMAMLALLWLEPTRVHRHPKRGTNDLVILVDNGEGMQVHEGRSLPARLASVRDAQGTWWTALHDLFRVESFVFGDRLVQSDRVDLMGNRSDLGAALEGLRQRYARRPLAGILLFSDGNVTDRERLERVHPGVPVFPVVVGQPPNGADLAITGLAVSESGFEDAPVTVSVQVSATALAGQTCRIQVLDAAGKELVVERVPIRAASQSIPARLRFRGATSGISACRVVVRPDAEGVTEITDRNNARDFVVDMGRGNCRILYVAGRPNWEYKFLNRAVQRDEEMDLVALVRLAKREPKFDWRGRAGERTNPLFRGFDGEAPEGESYDKPVLQRLNTRDAKELSDGFPQEREALFPEYDAIILDDLESAFFTAEQLNLLESFVSRRGGALLMLGGQESLQLGGYERTPMERLLPVYLDRSVRGEEAPPANLRFTREGLLEPWVRLRLTQDEEEKRLAELPAFQTLNEVRSVKPGATVLATAVTAAGEETPALAVHAYGEGRVGALMIGDIWRWGMEEAALRKDMETWWRQVMRWLVSDVPGFVQVTTAWAGVEEPATRKIEVRVRTKGWRPEENADVGLEVRRVGDADATTLFAEPSLDEPGLFRADFVCPEPGNWEVRAKVSGSDAEGNSLDLGTAQAGWAWNPAADEYASLGTDRPLLEALAKRTGGRVLEWDGLESFAWQAANLDVPVVETVSNPAWHHPLWFLCAICLVVAEWGIRRWKGWA